MHLTLDQITAREGTLRQEISERQRLLAAYQLIRADRLGPLTAAPPPTQPPPAEITSLGDCTQPANTSPASRPVLPQVNLELEALSLGHGGTGRAAAWAIRQMTTAFTVRDVAAVLHREGCPIPLEKLSVVLNRMALHGAITAMSRGSGRTPSVFCAPADAVAPASEEFEQNGESNSTADLAATVQEATPASVS